jgi:uncharacterized protein YecE (DUF72 family)
MSRHGRIRIGTSGWSYRHWHGPFYPDDVSIEAELAFYAGRFETAEVNNSFYQLPDVETLEAWADETPADFRFAVKASRYITHMKKLKDPEEPVANFLDRMQTLGGRLGPVLFQLPPRWRINVERLESFLQALPDSHRYAFEFRDPSWYDERVFAALSERGAAFCVYELAGHASPREVTADFVYVRLHGPDAAYEGRYDRHTLSGWAGALSAWTDTGRDVWCYFDNDQAGYAALNARELADMVGRGD